MDTTFNIQRFWKLVCNEFLVNQKKVLQLVGGLFGFIILFIGFNAIIHQQIYYVSAIWFSFFVVLVFQSIVTSIYFSDYLSKPKTLSLLMLPASKIEKFTSKSLFCFLFFPLLSVIYMWLFIKLSMIYNANVESIFGDRPFSKELNETIMKDFFSKVSMIYYLIGIWFVVASAYLCGAQFFKRRAGIKTFMICLVLFFLATPLLSLMYYWLTGHYADVYAPFILIMERSSKSGFFSCDFQIQMCNLDPFIGLYLLVVSWVRFNEKTV